MSEVTTAAPAVDTGSTEATSTEVTENTDAPTKAEVKEMKEKFTYKVDGEDVEEEIDLSNKEELTKRLRLSRAAEKRMAEAKAEKSKAFDIVKAFENDPASILKRLGPKGREAAEAFLLEQIQDEMMTPEQKRALKDQQELEGYRTEKQKREDASKKAEETAAEDKYRMTFENTILEALKKANLPKTPQLVADMARFLKKNLQMGLELDADDLVKEVKNDKINTLKALAHEATPEQLLEIFGPEIANKIRKHDLKSLQEKQQTVFGQKATVQQSERTDKESKPQSIEEWRESVNKRVGL